MDPAAAFLDALKARDPARAAQLVRDKPALLSARAPDGTSLLIQALYQRADVVVDAFLGQGAKPDVHEAAALGDAARLRALVATDRGLLAAKSADGWTPLHLAAHFGRGDAAVALLNLGADVAARSSNFLKNTPAHAAAAGGHAALVHILAGAGAPLDAQDALGNTVLHVAAANGLVDAARVLVQRGATRDVKNKKGETPAMLADEHGEGEIAALLRG